MIRNECTNRERGRTTAIIEYDGGATRELAERMALQEANKRVKK